MWGDGAGRQDLRRSRPPCTRWREPRLGVQCWQLGGKKIAFVLMNGNVFGYKSWRGQGWSVLLLSHRLSVQDLTPTADVIVCCLNCFWMTFRH